MKVSFAITVCNELNEIKRLIPFLLEKKRTEDEIVILYDEKNGDENILDFLLPYNVLPNVQTWRGIGFKENFAEWKNKLNDYCSGDYIFQLDADEMISEFLVKNVHEIIDLNPEVELFYVPRHNIVDGITENHIKKWNWRMDEKGRINFPDYQGRIYRKGSKWVNKVHERIEGIKNYSILPMDQEEYHITHHKDIKKQEKQNLLYSKI
jgi:hypothetical protein